VEIRHRSEQQERLLFRAARILLGLDLRWLAILLGILFLPILAIPDLTVQLILLSVLLGALMWVGGVPRYDVNEDGYTYRMDGRETAEKYFIQRGWWIWRS
jgi:hypothetical protein